MTETERASLLEKYGLAGNTLPAHVGIIMDGNGRFATALGKSRSYGHRAGMERLRAIITFSSDVGIRVLSVYAFSTENWKRPKTEVSALFSLLVEYFGTEIDALDRNNVRIRALGDIYDTNFPKAVSKAVHDAIERTKDNTGLTLCVALNYGAYAEALRAFELLRDVPKGDLTEEKLKDSLYTAGLPDMDLLIRTGGEMRLSNFMLLQAAYAELYFTDVLWPNFDDLEYSKALREFAHRQRRFGGL